MNSACIQLAEKYGIWSVFHDNLLCFEDDALEESLEFAANLATQTGPPLRLTLKKSTLMFFLERQERRLGMPRAQRKSIR